MRILFILSGLIVSLVSCGKEKPFDVTDENNLDAVIESEFKYFDMPGLAYAAVKDDSIVFMGAKGYADLHDKISFTPQTRMQIASISKVLLAITVLQLYEQGLVSLEKDISTYLDFEVRNPRHSNIEITIEMLLTHTSSIVDDDFNYSKSYVYGYVDHPESLASFLKNYLSKNGKYFKKNNFSKASPGESHKYTNIGASLIALIVEKVSGVSYNDYCKTYVFIPLGMNRTTWFYKETPKEEVAIPYAYNGIRNPPNPFFSFPTYPDGHLISTVEDMSKLLSTLILKGAFKQNQILKPETVELIFQNQTPEDASQGYIFFKKNMGKYNLWGHDGSETGGIITELFFSRKKNIGFVMFSNCIREVPYPNTIGSALLLYADK